MNALAPLLALIHLTLVHQHPTLPQTVDTVEGRDGQVWAWSTPLKGGWLLPLAGADACLSELHHHVTPHRGCILR